MLLEALNASNIAKYNEACSASKGTPVVFFLPIQTSKGRYRKKGSGSPSITFLERWLIAAALGRNSKLINSKETSFLRNITVVGILNAKRGEATSASQQLRKTLWTG
jgi:hypothetical protein